MSKPYLVTAKRELHGMTRTPEYISWYSAKTRALNGTIRQSDMYSKRGIKMCVKWQRSFMAFFRDMGERPRGTTLDRIDNSKGYYPDNCKWSTIKEQNNNRRKRTEYYHCELCGDFVSKGMRFCKKCSEII